MSFGIVYQYSIHYFCFDKSYLIMDLFTVKLGLATTCIKSLVFKIQMRLVT